MLIYFAKRLPGAFFTLFFLALITFFALRLAPGGPFDSDQAWPPEIKANIARAYKLDQPVSIQFLDWVINVAQGNLQESFQYLGRPVTEMIAETLPVSATVGFGALLFALLLGVPLGCMAAQYAGSYWDRGAMLLAVSGMSLPSYLVASLLVLVFALYLQILPPALWESGNSWVLPVITLGWRPMGILAKLTRESMMDALSSDYIRTALGKGVPQNQVIFKHALRNSLIPVVTTLGSLTANLLTGSFLVETVFQIPGMGRHFVQAVLNRDYPLVMGVTLVYGALLISANLGVDLMYVWLDPRIRLQNRGL